MRRLKLLIFLLAYIGVNVSAYAFNYIPLKKINRVGFCYGYGSQLGIIKDYEYSVHLFQLQYYYTFYEHKNFELEILTQPQVNFTRYKHDQNEKLSRGFEVGLNMGILARKIIKKDSYGMILIVSSGPHYVSGTPSRQKEGFIFSDNFLLGMYKNITKSLSTDFTTGLRHISNASLEHPNGGVNNFVFNIGFYNSFN